MSEPEHVHAHHVRDRLLQSIPGAVAVTDRVRGVLVRTCESGPGDDEVSLVSEGAVRICEECESLVSGLNHCMSVQVVQVVLSFICDNGCASAGAYRHETLMCSIEGDAVVVVRSLLSETGYERQIVGAGIFLLEGLEPCGVVL